MIKKEMGMKYSDSLKIETVVQCCRCGIWC